MLPQNAPLGKLMRPTAPHWMRFRHAMRLTFALALAAALAALLYLRFDGTNLPWQGKLAVALGVSLTVLLGGALMSLVFASSRGGHDGATHDLSERDRPGD